MQPLLYLAVRALFGWVQFIERSERAFLHNSLVLVGAGAVHCMPVVYSLFVAVHTRALRHAPYHEGYTEHLPSSVAWTETLAVACLWTWVLAGFTKAAVLVLDEDSGTLQSGLADTKANMIMKISRSRMFHDALGHAHSVSCTGLFVSIVMLCITMMTMKGGITVGEVCLAVVSISFATPHALLAVQRLSESATTLIAEVFSPQAVEAAAAEAAAFGPQLCIILALADAPDHAFLLQKIAYVVTAVSFVANVVASAHYPAKSSDVALPPQLSETFVCLTFDGMAALVLVLSYPDLNTWFLWAGFVVLVGLAGATKLQDVRQFFREWLEAVFVVRGDTYKQIPNTLRQRLQTNAWIACFWCGLMALWDIGLHRVPQPS